jgi:hypothetical protein
VLLKLVLYAYSRGILSSRKIEDLCKENTVAMALTGYSCPDHSTIASFILKMETPIQSIFEDILMVCLNMNLIGGDIFAIDGCKISSNASKEHSGKLEDFKRKRDRLSEIVKTLMKEHKEADTKNNMDEESKSNLEERIERKKKAIDRYKKFIERNEKKAGKRKEELQSNITDNETAKMQSSHGVIQGYNTICKNCPLRSRCMKNPKRRSGRILVTTSKSDSINYSAIMREK